MISIGKLHRLRREKGERWIYNYFNLFWKKKSFFSLSLSVSLSVPLSLKLQSKLSLSTPYPEMESKECLCVEKKNPSIRECTKQSRTYFVWRKNPQNHHNYRYFLRDGKLSSISSFKRSFLPGPNTIWIIQKYCLDIYCYNRTQHI